MTSENGYARREAFDGEVKRRYGEVDVPGFGKVCIQSLTEDELARWQASSLNKRGEPVPELLVVARLELFALTVVDPKTHERWFDAGSARDRLALRNMDSVAGQILHEACAKHVGFGTKEDLEEMVKNFRGASATDSASG